MPVVPDWLHALKTRPAHQRPAPVHAPPTEVAKTLDGERVWKNTKTQLEVTESLLPSVGTADRDDYDLVIDHREAIPRSRGNAWGPRKGRWNSQVAVQYAGVAEKMAYADVEKGRRFDLGHGQQLDTLLLDEVRFPNGETFTPEDGAIQNNIVLAEKPVPGTNSWAFTLDLPDGAHLAPQAKLTPEQIAAGDQRPEWVVGSYAVFAADGRKLGHIPRPYAVAGDGKWTWGTWEWDAGTATLTKSFPDAWLQAAKYPVTVDLTFGGTAAGGTSSAVADQIFAYGPVSPTENGVVRTMAFYADASVATNTYNMSVYSNNAGTPQTNLGDGVESTPANLAAGVWLKCQMDSPISVSSGTSYWLALCAEPGGASMKYYYDDPGASGSLCYANFDFSTSPDTLPAWPGTAWSDASRYMAIYAIYTETIDTSTWEKQATIVIDTDSAGFGIDGDVDDHPAYIQLTSCDCAADGADIRFTLTTGAAVATLPFEIEKISGAAGAYTVDCWVLLDLDNDADTTFYAWTDADGGRSDGQAPEAVWAPGGYLVVWHLGEASNPYLDSTVYGNDSVGGTYPDQAVGAVGSGQDFVPASSEEINLPSGFAYPCVTADEISVSAWLNPDTISASTTVENTVFWSPQAIIRLENSADAECYVAGDDGALNGIDADGIWTTGSWQHAVLWFDNTDLKVFRNGSEATTTAAYSGEGVGIWATSERLGGSGTDYFDGKLDELRVTRIARSADDLKAEYELIANQGTHVSGAGTWSGEPVLLYQTVTETLGLADQAVKGVGKTVVESIGLADAPVKSTGKLLSDALGLADQAVKGVGKTVVESIGLADAPVKSAGKLLSDALGLADQAARLVGKPLTETLALSDSATKLAGKTLAEALGLTDAAEAILGKILVETLALADSAARLAGKPLTETLGLADAVTRQVAKPLTETLGLADAVTKQAAKTVAEQLALTDSIASLLLLTQTIVETLGLADSVTRQAGKVVVEGLALADALVKTAGLTVTEQLALSDSLVKLAALALAETLGLSDSVATAAAQDILGRLRALDQTLRRRATNQAGTRATNQGGYRARPQT